jgi:hypothetical protein
MGSFANNLHVRSDDSNIVATTIQDMLIAEGYRLTDEEPDEEASWGMPSSKRAVYISESHNGWVGVLDTAMMDSIMLAVSLSRQLSTHAIYLMVNDSDSWHYQLFRNGEEADKFNSSPDAGGEFGFGCDFSEHPLAEAFRREDIAGFQEVVEQKSDEIQQWMEANMPAEVRDILHKIEQGNIIRIGKKFRAPDILDLRHPL